jgi:hypothetical protein
MPNPDESTNWTDPIVEEIRRIREEHAARFNYNLQAIVEDLQKREKESANRVVSLAPRKITVSDVEHRYCSLRRDPMGQTRELPVPAAVSSAENAFEIARIWITEDCQHISLATDIWNDPAAWGLMLVDLARHVARAYEQREGRDPEKVLARIKEGFDAEWNNPTDTPKGNILN